MLIFAAMPADAQNRPEACLTESNIESGWNVKWGPELDFHIFMPANWTSSHIYPGEREGYGGGVGIAVRFEYDHHPFIQTGLGFEFDSAPILMDSPHSGMESVFDRYRYTRGGLILPILGGFRFRLSDEIGISAFTGVRGSWTFADRLKCPPRGSVYKMTGSDGVWRPLNLQWSIGAMLELEEQFSVGVSGNLGVIQMERRNIFTSRTMYESNVCVSAIYWLRL